MCDLQVPSLGDVTHLYVRSFDIEMAFRLLKEYLGIVALVEEQAGTDPGPMWVVLILSHIVYALHERIATATTCETFEVPMPRHGGTDVPTLQRLRVPIRAAHEMRNELA